MFSGLQVYLPFNSPYVNYFAFSLGFSVIFHLDRSCFLCFLGDGRNTTKAVCVISGEVADASCSQCEITYLTTTNWTIPGLRACEHSNFTWRGIWLNPYKGHP